MYRSFYNIFEWLLHKDQQYATLFKGHWHFYILEYVVFPILLFLLVFKMVRKEKESAHFLGLNSLIEVVSRNWLELAFTFIIAWIAFELRVYSDLHASQIHMPTAKFSPLQLSALSVLVFCLVSLMYYLLSIRGTGLGIPLPDDYKLPERVSRTMRQVQLSFIPFFLLLNLIILVLTYPMSGLRIIISLIVLVVLIVLMRRLRLTSSFLWEVGTDLSQLPENKKSVSAVLSSINCFIRSAKKIPFRKNLERRCQNTLDAQGQCLYLISTLRIGPDRPEAQKLIKMTLKELGRCIRQSKKRKKTNQEKILITATNEVKTALKHYS